MSEEFLDLRTFTRQIHLRGVLTSQTGLRMGAGQAYDLPGDDLPLVKDALERPVIPGSSLKGALRAYAERVLRTLEPLTGKPRLACDPLVDPCLTNEEVAAIKRQKNADGRFRNRSCWACRLFGAPWMASKVLVKDLNVQEGAWFDQFGHRDGVSIDRDKGTAQNKRRYTLEVVPKETPFDFEMVVMEATDAERGLLLLVLEGINNGLVLLGGARSRGQGSVNLRVDWEHVEEITPQNALAALGSRALGQEERVPTSAWTRGQREGWIEMFFQAIGLPEAEIVRWREARSQAEVEDEAQ